MNKLMNVYSLFMYFRELDFLATDTKYTFLDVIKCIYKI